MLSNIYFRSTLGALARLLKARDEYGSLKIQMREAYRASGTLKREEWIGEVNKNANKINEAVENLKKEILVAARLNIGKTDQIFKMGSIPNPSASGSIPN